jgi:serine/threonine protein phosphatase PrpC/CRP-like cAMP-binding protein
MCVETLHLCLKSERTLYEQYLRDPQPELLRQLGRALFQAVQVANEKIYTHSQGDSRGMCTTVVVWWSLGDHALITHAGDSRAYLVRAGRVIQITEDHRFGVEMVKEGVLTPAQAAKSPYARTLSRAVGHEPSVKLDLLQLEIRPGDRWILCTDGVSDYIERDEWLTQSSRMLKEVAEWARQESKRRGGRDNLTLVLGEASPTTRTNPRAVDLLRKFELLGRIPAFQHLTYIETLKLLSATEVREFPQETLLYREGDLSKDMYLIVRGSAKVIKERVEVALRVEGDLIGEMGLLDDAPRSASVQITSGSTLIRFGRAEVMELFRKESVLAVKFLWATVHDLSSRLRRATAQVAGQENERKQAAQALDPHLLPFALEDSDQTLS